MKSDANKMQLIRKIGEYKKSDIISALADARVSEWTLLDMLNSLRQRVDYRLFEEQKAAIGAWKETVDAFNAWKNDMCKRFGDGEKVNLSDIPSEEIRKGEALEIKKLNAYEIVKQYDKKINKLTE